ncbi:hypothetical protein AOX55_0000266 [Sinorhizobium fredii CCBAU 25509]|nr:hypothetical protein AOX55_0000266 [Sinorhizobium fredii CCBAU 25509]
MSKTWWRRIIVYGPAAEPTKILLTISDVTRGTARSPPQE